MSGRHPDHPNRITRRHFLYLSGLAAIRPTPDELRWRAIPWQTDLRTACRMAAEQGKPVFLWTMNGNPLGCT